MKNNKNLQGHLFALTTLINYSEEGLINYPLIIFIKKGIHSNHPHIPFTNNIYKIYTITFLFLL